MSRRRARWPSLSGLLRATEELQRNPSASAAVANAEEESPPADDGEDRWSRLLPELLGEIVRRVDADGQRWPQRKDVVSCACVCRRWREVTKSVVRSPVDSGRITFPSSLKQPGPSDSLVQCFIKRNKNESMFYLYLGLTHSFVGLGKFLMAAQRYRRGAHIEYVISLDADDMSQTGYSYLGKLRSDFIGTNFCVYDSQPLGPASKGSSRQSVRQFGSKRVSPQPSFSSSDAGRVSYQFNLLKSRGPRRIRCTLHSAQRNREDPESKPTVLRNKAPRWHEHLQCWCLNFHGRVTVASVKNFQLMAAAAGGVDSEETVLLQFGKVGDNVFTMDYRRPISAFQAFAICLTSFGTKLACE